MTMSDATRSKLLELVADLRSEKSRLEKKYQDELSQVDIDLQAVQRTLDLLFNGTDVKEKLNSQLAVDIAILPLISEAITQYKALKIMGERNQGNMVNITRAADMLIRAGRAKGKRRNLVITVHNYFKNNEDEWVWVSPGNFKFVGM